MSAEDGLSMEVKSILILWLIFISFFISASGLQTAEYNLAVKYSSFDKESITVPADSMVTINFDNQDSHISHNFAVYSDSAGNDAIFKGDIITGPAMKTYIFKAPHEPGTYFFMCDIHPDDETGKLIVIKSAGESPKNESHKNGISENVISKNETSGNQTSQNERLEDNSVKNESSKDVPAKQTAAIPPDESNQGLQDRYLEVLKSKDYEYMRESIKSLQETDGPQSVDNLILALQYNDSTVRDNAAEALLIINDTRAVDPLIDTLNDEDSNVRAAAAHALGNIKDVRAVEPLIQAFKDKHNIGRMAALNALDQIGDPKAVDPMIQAVDDSKEDPDIQVMAAQTLGRMKDIRALDVLLKALEYEDYGVRAMAAQSLGNLGDTKAVEPLILALKDKDSEVRDRAAYALGKIGDTRAVDPLIQALEDKDGDVRMSAAFALGEIGDARAVDPLTQTLKDRDSLVRQNAAWSLEKLGSTAAAMETGQEAESIGVNHPPTISKLYPVSDNVRSNIGESFTFRIEAEDEDANLKELRWISKGPPGVYGGGHNWMHGPSCERSFKVTYTIPGNYSLIAQAADELDEESQVSWNVTVADQT